MLAKILSLLRRRREGSAEPPLSDEEKRKTDVLPIVRRPGRSLETHRDRSATRRLLRPDLMARRAMNSDVLLRDPLLIEVVLSGSVGPSPITRPDLIGKTIAGGSAISGATSTANVGLRSSPSGYAVNAHLSIPPGRYSKKHVHKHKKRKKNRK